MLADAHARIAELETQLRNAENTESRMQATIVQLTRENFEHAGATAQLARQLASAQAATADLAARLTASETDSNLRQASATEECSRLRRTVADTEHALDAARRSLERSERRVLDLQEAEKHGADKLQNVETENAMLQG